MYGTLFKAVAKPGKFDELVASLRGNAKNADLNEPDTLRIDVWPVRNEPDAVYVYEAYSDPKGFDEHKKNAPYHEFMDHIVPHVLDRELSDVMPWTESLASNDGERASSPQRPPGSEFLIFDDFPVDPEAGKHFDGEAVLRRITARRNAAVSYVQFEPGVQTHWHQHGGDQLLWFIEGTGVVSVQTDGVDRSCTTSPGDIVRIRGGVRHRHGASKVGAATHLAITIGATVWGEPTAK